ncbi:hypothetical protein GH714_025358 [Hevea brasiliensis]|uniref:SHSP domain-containing protein n=1 Tax=Hevea brasiliensis TaxID=3981 RepID=A0A6A6NJB5_HEVBR|nr:hypothetical protein GH714_025358 [Hevea brasiliensis]
MNSVGSSTLYCWGYACFYMLTPKPSHAHQVALWNHKFSTLYGWHLAGFPSLFDNEGSPISKEKGSHRLPKCVAFSTTAGNPIPKKLKRLPHVFARVLELPFNSDAEVFVQETKECFRFVANGGDITITDDFQAHVIEILPGVTKIAIRGAQSVDRASVEDLDIDMWRFRLPTTTFPKMTSARCIGGQLVVTVPKTLNFEDDDNYGKEEEEEECEEDTSKESLRGYFLLGEE